MSIPNQTTGRLINFYRRQHQLKQEYLAEKAGITQSVLSEIENDKHVITVPLLLKFAEIFNLPPSALLPDNKPTVFNNHFSNDSPNEDINVFHQRHNFEQERKMFIDLIIAKEEIIRAKDQLLLQLGGKI